MNPNASSPSVNDKLPPVPPQALSSPRNNAALQFLARQARQDLEHLNYPPPAWVLPTPGPGGQDVLDVLVVGAGMCGQTAGYALMREGVQRIRVIDANARGDEGPWGTYARMLTLRSPKQLTGPDLGVPALTFRAWYEAQHGTGKASPQSDAPGWAALHKVGRIDWRDYLLWVRDTVGLAVDNRVRLMEVSDADGLACARLQGPHGEEIVRARKLVLALGRDGSGAPRWPEYPSLSRSDPLARGRVFHSADAIDFSALAGKHIAVLGAGASAFDNAACALEAGARVTQFARRTVLPQINKSKAASFQGFLRGFEALDDARKWRFYTYIFDEQVPPPWETVRRCDAHAGFMLRLGSQWRDVRPGTESVAVHTNESVEYFDAVVFGTGFDVDLLERPEIARYSQHIDTWARHVPPEQAKQHPEPARFPYLGRGFALQSASGEHADALGRMHLFNWGATMSHGPLGGDIPGLQTGATRLAEAIVSDLFVQDADRHWQRLQAHDEAELLPTRWYVPPAA